MMRAAAATRRLAAFTLIELMIVLAIVAALASWGVPSYRAHVARMHRTAAVSALYRAAQYLETLDGPPPQMLPDAYTQAPPDGQPVYRLTLRRPADGDASVAYELVASPLDAAPMRDDPCGAFTLRSDGTKGNAVADTGQMDEPSRVCWGVR
ncbi:type IV pilin protein [Burkholderia vietnamiensis]|uniref:type IV pilin protein n=1 Tax=Burkholderia vietnamiensis TaxID=60552 RepID=UPI001CB5E1E9|nr:type IV pilin protein [Burkholderia vietnamiensis]CAG9194050.1 Putative Tfp pilus assembly protein PilE [Burkholderia vietnamiensis]HDR8968371.1 prepilin-type N-terminal cleavage/methylation domain-containing protein [Burkholderia vietnamiensis]